MVSKIEVGQINVGKRGESLNEMIIRTGQGSYDIICLQEVWTLKKDRNKLKDGELFITSKSLDKPPRTAIWLRDNLRFKSQAHIVEEFSHRDATVLILNLKICNEWKKVLLASLYLPSYTDPDQNNKSIYIKNPITTEMSNMCDYAAKNNLEILICCDANAYNKIWKMDKNNTRGESLINFAVDKNLIILNKGDTPTFVQGNKSSIIDITLASPSLSTNIAKWQVDLTNSFSDHRYISMDILAENFSCDPKYSKNKTKWTKFKKSSKPLIEKLSRHIITVKDLDSLTSELSNILHSTYLKCTRQVTKKKYFKDWYDDELDDARKQCNRASDIMCKAFKNNLPDADVKKILYHNLRNSYNKKCKKAKFNAWKKNLEKIDSVKDLAKLQKFFENGKSSHLGALVKENGEYTATPDETELELMKTHFPNCIITEPEDDDEEILIDCDQLSTQEISDWITIDKVKWAINSSSPFKASASDNIFPALLQKADEAIIPILREIFVKSVTFGYIPKIWRNTIVKFIPKSAKSSYDRAKSFRPISLLSVPMKALDKILDLKIKSEALVKFPIEEHQYAYTPMKSVETALHHYVEELERGVENGGFAVSIFCDIVSAFDSCSFNVIERELSKIEVPWWLIRWLKSMLNERLMKADIVGGNKLFKPTQGLPQGATISCTIWNIIINGLIKRLELKVDIFNPAQRNVQASTKAFADDVTITLFGKISRKDAILDVGDTTMMIFDEWCTENELSLSAEKTTAMVITKNKVRWTLRNITLKGEPIRWVKTQKLLGVYIDNTLSWIPHLDYVLNRAKRSLFMSRALASKTWGISPYQMYWIYKAMIIPRITFSCIVWWKKTELKCYADKLNSIQRMAALMICGAPNSTPSYAMFNLLNLSPLDIKIQIVATTTAIRLRNCGDWKQNSLLNSHTSIQGDINKLLGNKVIDSITVPPKFLKKYVVLIRDENRWNENIQINSNPDCWFTDASRKEEKSSIGLYNPYTLSKLGYRLSDNTNITLAEIMAIKKCAETIIQRNSMSNNVVICSDSVQALKTLDDYRTSSKTVQECKNLLESLAATKHVTLVWVPKKTKFPHHVISDEVAKESLHKTLIEINSYYSITSVNNSMTELELVLSNTRWREKKNLLGFAKNHVGDYNENKFKELIRLRRSDLRVAVGLKTGHVSARKHLNRIGKSSTANCRFCNLQPEDVQHWLEFCPVLKLLRLKHFGTNIVNANVFVQTKTKILLKFAKESGIYDIYFQWEENPSDIYDASN
jgi:Reverse transcriptase (RNA-dependent DNA polymerase)/Endonuclease-reverse transcriptase